MAYCTNCGANLPENAKFCPECGANVFSSSDTQTIQTVTFTVFRRNTLAYSARSTAIYIDGKYVEDLKPGEEWSGKIECGEHTIGIQIGKSIKGSSSFEIKGSTPAKIEFYISSSGDAAFTFFGDANEVVADLLPKNHSSRITSKTTQSNNSGCLWMIIGVVLFLLILYFLMPGFSEGFKIGLNYGMKIK